LVNPERAMMDALVTPLLDDLDERLTRVEQILPTLAAKADLAPLATTAEARAHDALRVSALAPGPR